MPAPVRPLTLIEALHLIADQAAQEQVIRQAASPSVATPLGIDMSRLSERNGFHQLGGRLVAGLNMTVAEMATSSLVRSQATCLYEASAYLPLAGDSSLALAFPELPAPLTSSSELWPLILALLALDAEVELAWLGAGDGVERSSVAMAFLSAETLPKPLLPLAVSFAVSGRRGGSAFVPAPATPGMTPAPLAAAVRLALASDARTVAGAGVALAFPTGAMERVTSAETCLQGRPLDPASIGAAAREAQQFALARWPAAPGGRGYPIQLAAHLVRTALDRASARALDTTSALAPF